MLKKHKQTHILLLIFLLMLLFQRVPTSNLQDVDNHILKVDWSPDGRYIVMVTSERELITLDASSGDLIGKTLVDEVGEILDMAISPDSRLVGIVGSEPILTIYDITTGAMRFTFDLALSSAHELAWSPDGQYLATASNSGYPDNIRIWDTNNNEVHFTIPGGDLETIAIAWSQQNLLAVSFTARIEIWDVVSEQKLRVIETLGFRSSLQWSVDGQALLMPFTSYSLDKNTVQIVDITETPQPRFWGDFPAFLISAVWDAAQTQVITTSVDGTVYLLKSETPQPLITDIQPFPSAAWSPYGGQIAVGVGFSARVEAANGVLVTEASRANGVAIIVPSPSFEQLNTIAAACVRDRRSDAPEALALDDAPVTAATLAAFLARLDALPDGTIPPACAADLRAVAGALSTR